MIDILVVGNCCHDTLIHPHGEYEALGGSTSYISAALQAAGVNYRVIGKVGRDFLYTDRLLYKPLVSETAPTTYFVDDMRPAERVCILKAVCEPIRPADLPRERARIGIACGVATELLPETLAAMRERVDILVCDAQGMLRQAGPSGEIFLRKISETGFAGSVDAIDYLKASESEARFIDVPAGRAALVITAGPEGSRLVRNDRSQPVPSTPVKEVDATGAGDSFVAGLSLGLLNGLAPVEAIRQGNRYGAFCTQWLGVPDFSKLPAV
jgi:1D-myo-inositol 3-kinase